MSYSYEIRSTFSIGLVEEVIWRLSRKTCKLCLKKDNVPIPKYVHNYKKYGLLLINFVFTTSLGLLQFCYKHRVLAKDTY